jgi:hypothetical protein
MQAMTQDRPVSLTHGLPETVLAPAPAEAREGLDAALAVSPAERKNRLASVVARYPTFLDGWAALSEGAAAAGGTTGNVEAYAYARVGYHRGLDSLRAAGWRGSGYVRWTHETNRGFLRSLEALRSAAAAIGETEEEQRCGAFLRQLDPDWDEVAREGLRRG